MRLFGLITLALVAMAVIAITPVLSQNMNEPTVTKDQSGMGEGIKVHGDWQVKVTDPETGQEELYAFRNKLEDPALFVALLANEGTWTLGQKTNVYQNGEWAIQGSDSSNNKEFFNKVQPMCVTPNLTMMGNQSDLDNLLNPISATLAGTCTVPDKVTKIDKVVTRYGGRLFTSKSFKGVDAIQVQPGQLVAFNFSLSFE